MDSTTSPSFIATSATKNDISAESSKSHSATDTFPTKTHHLIVHLDKHNPEIAAFSADGSSFEVYDQATFSQQYLPQYFKHSNWGSFVRQLNLYGFTSSRSRDNADVQVWRHEYFHRDKKESVEKIKRTKRNKNASSQNNGNNGNQVTCTNNLGNVSESPSPAQGSENPINHGIDSPELSEGSSSMSHSDGRNLKISPSDHEWLDAEFAYLKHQNKLLEQKLDMLLQVTFDKSNANSIDSGRGFVVEPTPGEGDRKKRKVARVGTHRSYPHTSLSLENSNRDRLPLFHQNLQRSTWKQQSEPVQFNNYANTSVTQQQRTFCSNTPFHNRLSSNPSTGAKNVEDQDLIELIDNILHEDQGSANEGGKSLDDCDSSMNGPSIPSIDCMSALSGNDNVPTVTRIYRDCENGNRGLNLLNNNMNTDNRAFTGQAPQAPQWIPRSLYNTVKLAGPDPVPSGVHIVDPDEEQGADVNFNDVANEIDHYCDAQVDHVPAEVTIVSAHLVQDHPDIHMSEEAIYPSQVHRQAFQGRFHKHRKTLILGIVGAVACAAFISIPIVVLDRDDDMHANIQDNLDSIFKSEDEEMRGTDWSDDFSREFINSSDSSSSSIVMLDRDDDVHANIQNNLDTIFKSDDEETPGTDWSDDFSGESIDSSDSSSSSIVMLDRDDDMHANIQDNLDTIFKSDDEEMPGTDWSDDFSGESIDSSDSSGSSSDLDESKLGNNIVSVPKKRSGATYVKSGSIVAENGSRMSNMGIGREDPMGETEWNMNSGGDGDEDVQNERYSSLSKSSYLGSDEADIVQEGEAALEGYTHENFDVKLDPIETRYDSTIPPPVPPSFDDANQDFWKVGRHGSLFTERDRSNGSSIREVFVSIGEEHYFCTQSHSERLIR